MDIFGPMARFSTLPESSSPVQPFTADEGCYIQFSSGSTRFPLGVDIRQKTLMANVKGISEFGLDIRPTDRGTSWLPFYHDMGLIGFLLVPMCSQRTLDFLSPRDFA